MAAKIDRNVDFDIPKNKGVSCTCMNSECERYKVRMNRPRRENSLGICRACGIPVKAIGNTRENLKLERAKKEYEKLIKEVNSGISSNTNSNNPICTNSNISE